MGRVDCFSLLDRFGMGRLVIVERGARVEEDFSSFGQGKSAGILEEDAYESFEMKNHLFVLTVSSILILVV